MKLTREKGLRMWGGGGTGGSGGGGGLDPSALAGYATMGWVEDNYVSKAFFNQMFELQYNHRVLTKNGDVVVSDVTTAMVAAPNEVVDTMSHTETDEETGYTIITTNTITGIKAKAGFWTNQYLSALGQNSSGGGGGGASSLSKLLDVTISSPSGGQVLTYSNGQWINAAIPTPSMTGYATETWVEINFASLTWIGQQGYLTSSSLSDYATQSWVNNQISDMATKTWVTNNFLGLHATADAATKLVTARELWGRSFDGTASVTGTLSYVGDINSNTNGNINNFNGIEMSYKAGSGHGGGIFFHWNGVTGYSSAYIYHDADNHINMFGHTAGFGVQVGYQNGDYLQIGAVRLVYDTWNNALKVINSDGTAANLYATGGVSALGMSAGVSSIEAMTFGYMTVEHKISINDGDFESKIYNDASGNMVLYGSEGLKVESDLFIESNYVYADGVQANRFCLDSTRYLYVSGGTLYYYNGSTSKQVAFKN